MLLSRHYFVNTGSGICVVKHLLHRIDVPFFVTSASRNNSVSVTYLITFHKATWFDLV